MSEVVRTKKMSDITREQVQALFPEYPLTDFEFTGTYFKCLFTNGKEEDAEDFKAVAAQFRIEEDELKNNTNLTWELALNRVKNQLQYYIDWKWYGIDHTANIIKEAEELLKD